jgi:glycosyltransferase involved in cell wall biosynthesis
MYLDRPSVLLITWCFPPLNHTASKRSGCFAKYLPQYGWRATVLCPEWTPDNCVYDPEYVKNIPDSVRVHKVPYRSTEHLSLGPHLALKAYNFFFPHLIPYNWVHPAKEEISRIVAERTIDVIWSTFPGYGGLPHTLASWASKKWGIPWVADFRDIPEQMVRLIGEEKNDSLYRLRLITELPFEMKNIANAAEIVTVSQDLARRLSRRHRRRVHVIPNGFDPDDFHAPPKTAFPKFNMTFGGTLSIPHRSNPRPVLDAFARLIGKGLIDPHDVRLDFFGVDPETLERAFSGNAYANLARCYQRVAAGEYIEKIQSSCILLQFASDRQKGIITSKIFEYLAADRPILSVPRDNGCIDALLKETNAGIACTGIDEICDVLARWYLEWKATSTVISNARSEAIANYSRKKQTSDLSKLLDSITNKGHS